MLGERRLQIARNPQRTNNIACSRGSVRRERRTHISNEPTIPERPSPSDAPRVPRNAGYATRRRKLPIPKLLCRVRSSLRAIHGYGNHPTRTSTADTTAPRPPRAARAFQFLGNALGAQLEPAEESLWPGLIRRAGGIRIRDFLT